MGVIQGVKKLDDMKDINISEEMYQHIEKWKQLYQGYHEPFHKTEYQTIEDGKCTRTRSTLNVPKVASEELATLVFNERCQINFGDETFGEAIGEVLDACGFRREFQRYLEYMFALGGVVVKAHVENKKEIKLSYVNADSFIPTEWTGKKITGGIFLDETIKGDKRYAHLEWHKWEDGDYVIRHHVYEADVNSDELGIKVPLTTLYPEMKKEVFYIEGLKDCSMFVHIKPNSANNVDLNSPLGVSIFANAYDTIKAIDIAFDSFEREFILGKKRILVPTSAIKRVVDPETGQTKRYFDANDEVFEAFKFEGDDSNEFKDLSVELRVDEHIAAINALLNLFAMQIGFSAGAFSFDGQSMKTATEVVSEQSKTFRTKQSHEVLIEEGIKSIIDLIVALSDLYDLGINEPKDSKKREVTVTFDDSVAEDKLGDLQYWIQLTSNNLVSKKRMLTTLLGLTDEEAEQELLLVAEENNMLASQGVDFFGMNTNEEA